MMEKKISNASSDPHESRKADLKFLKYLFGRFHSEVCEDLN